MGVYIEGMEMPKSCIACHLHFVEKRPEYGLTICCQYSDGVISWRDKAFNNGRLASCGIVPVPPHGRLIDADALLEDVRQSASEQDAENLNDWWVGEMPTIIPAEEAET